MKTLKILVLTLVSAVFIGGAFTTASALPENVRELYTDPGEFYLDSELDREIVDFSKRRDLKLCVNQTGHTVGLTVKYDDKEKTVTPGNCLIFDAKNVVVSPADDLESGWIIKGKFDAM